jgi:hypothetical protein
MLDYLLPSSGLKPRIRGVIAKAKLEAIRVYQLFPIVSLRLQ